VFGEVAEVYDRARPGYPDELFDDLVRMGELAAGDPVLEIGAGTGKATTALLVRGLAVTALEPDAAMAGVLRQRASAAVVVDGDFETWSTVPDQFALVCAAQAWHWVRPDVGLTKAGDTLRPGGLIALWWNRPNTNSHPIQLELQGVYERLAPAIAENVPDPNVSARGVADQLRASDQFTDVDERVYEWSTSYDTTAYLELMTTHSPHRLLGECVVINSRYAVVS